MRVVIQRVASASVTIAGEEVAAIIWTAKTTQKIQKAMKADNFSYPGE